MSISFTAFQKADGLDLMVSMALALPTPPAVTILPTTFPQLGFLCVVD